MIKFKEVDPQTVELDFVGDITGEDYKAVKPQIETMMRKEGKVKFLMDLTKARGFNLGAVFQDIKFDLEHFKNIGATAVIASRKTWKLMTKAVNIVYPEKVHHFEKPSAGLRWLKSEAL